MIAFFQRIYKRIKKALIPYYIQFWLYPQKVRIYRHRLRSVRRRGQANVVFIASSLAMWKYQGLYDLLSQDGRFHPFIVLAPFHTFNEEQKEQSMRVLSGYFADRNTPCFDSRTVKDLGLWLRDDLRPDLIFYPQPYEELFSNELDWTNNTTCLISYIPYGALMLLEPWAYNSSFTNNAWRLYYQSKYNKRIARSISANRGKNIHISGYISTDDFINKDFQDPWKPQGKVKKRIIWAPHFSGAIQPSWLNRDGFGWLWQFMQEIAVRHKDTLQIAFKPHPRLLTTLYELPEWGKEKADAYFSWWANGENTQLETGQFVPLFKSSDAMIHDSNSFIADYLLAEKPVMFTAKNLEETEKQLDDFGKAALHAHYLAKTTQDVLNFILNVEADAPDPKAAERRAVVQAHLLPPNGKTAAENIYNDLLKAFHFKHK